MHDVADLQVTIKANPRKAEVAELRNRQEKARLLKNEASQTKENWMKKKGYACSVNFNIFYLNLCNMHNLTGL